MSLDTLTLEPRPRTAVKQRNREAILASARRVFAELGYEAASVRDIIRGTDLASGTFYNYFRSKEEIAAALAADAAERLRPLLRAERAAAVDFPGWLDGVLRAYFRFLVEEYGAAPAGRPRVQATSTPAQRAVFEEVRQSIAEVLGNRLAPGADTVFLAAAAIGVARGVADEMLRRDPPDADAAASFAARMILHGLPAAAGR